jgi:hypothetical protein
MWICGVDRVLRFSPVSFIPPVLHYKEKGKKLIIFITGLHNKPQGCGASVASAAGPFTTKKNTRQYSKCLILLASILAKYGVNGLDRSMILSAGLYRCEIWSLTLQEERRLKVLENMALRKTFGQKRDKVIGD